jgi:hypothetical protein
VRKTSLDAYNKLKASGGLSKARWKAYHLLYQHGPLIGSELDQHFGSQHGHKRIVELVALGLVEQVGRRIDPKSEMEADLWDVTSADTPIWGAPVGRPKTSARVVIELLRSRHDQRLIVLSVGDQLFGTDVGNGPWETMKSFSVNRNELIAQLRRAT